MLGLHGKAAPRPTAVLLSGVVLLVLVSLRGRPHSAAEASADNDEAHRTIGLLRGTITTPFRLNVPPQRRFSEVDIIDQVAAWRWTEATPPCDTLSPYFQHLEDKFTLGYEDHDLALQCDDMEKYVYAHGFQALMDELEGRGVLDLAAHKMTQMISVNALYASVDPKKVFDAFFGAKMNGLCWGTMVSGGIEHGMCAASPLGVVILVPRSPP